MSSTAIPSLPAPASRPCRLPELLAPAGDWECAKAAVENGADAIYFGLERFNARMRAHNFTQADLPALMAFLHRRGVRGYVTFNTLVFTDELADAEDYLRSIIAAGVDAAIVQDVGICRLIRELSPDFPIHTSTQMTVTSAAGVAFAHDLGAQLVVLARENSLKEIATIEATQRTGAATPLPLEVFVHGALCVAYSGQCLTSESLGGRSANRGECAQACRLPYELFADGARVDLGDRKYLLSPQDLAGLEVLPELIAAGVASLKIEGRLKSPEYVASITRVYRAALDRLAASAEAGTPPASATSDAAPGGDRFSPALPVAPAKDSAARYELQMAFSRGLYPGWFRGIDNQHLAHGRFGTKRGVFLGLVTAVGRDHVRTQLENPLKPGDGIVFDAGTPERGEEGGRVYSLVARGEVTELYFGRGDIDFTRVRAGQRIWKTNDPALDRELRSTFAGDKIRHTRALALEVHGRLDAPLHLIAHDGEGHVVRVDSTTPLVAATSRPLTPELLTEQLGRLGGTPFHLGSLESHLEGQVLLPLSELNRLRREMVTQLDALRAAPRRWDVRPTHSSGPDWTALPPAPCDPAPTVERAPPATPALILVVRNLAQLDAALSCEGIRTVYCEFENPKHYRDAVTRFRTWQASAASPLATPTPAAAASIWVVPPRITKPGEEWILKQVRSAEADGYLVRNYDHLQYFTGDRRRGDFSLNVANPRTAHHYLARHGLERVTASYDLNIAQLSSLLAAMPGDRLEITLHQHMPMFHMEHCVFCAFLSSGKDYHDCGRPCEKHAVHLRDRVGAEFPLKADAGCRNTVYNNRAQTGAEFFSHLVALGARHFRIEFLNETADELRRTVTTYQRLLHGEVDGAQVWRDLHATNQLGVTRGQLDATPQVILKKR